MSHAGPRIGWIGLGRMGAPMARRVIGAGLPLTVWARRPEAAQALQEAGAACAETPQALAQASDIVVTIVGGPADVQQLHALTMPAARPGTLFVDMSTAAPATAEAAQRDAAAHGLAVIDAPVTGGVAGAQRGTLTTFVGGEAAAREHGAALLQAVAARIVDCGGPGSGYRMKLINQTLMVGALLGVADGMRLARAAGLPAERLQQALSGGTGFSTIFENYLPRMLSGEGTVTFTLGLLAKDLRLARAEAQACGLSAPLLDAAVAAVAAARQRHGDDAGVQVLAQ